MQDSEKESLLEYYKKDKYPPTLNFFKTFILLCLLFTGIMFIINGCDMTTRYSQAGYKLYGPFTCSSPKNMCDYVLDTNFECMLKNININSTFTSFIRCRKCECDTCEYYTCDKLEKYLFICGLILSILSFIGLVIMYCKHC